MINLLLFLSILVFVFVKNKINKKQISIARQENKIILEVDNLSVIIFISNKDLINR